MLFGNVGLEKVVWKSWCYGGKRAKKGLFPTSHPAP